MNSLKTLYFPVTNIYSIRQFPLFLLFQNIHLIQPVEKSPDINHQSAENSFINSEFCQVHAPCPLKEHRERFLRLVKDIELRKDDYASQLSSLTLAAMSGVANDNESERNIVKAIFTPKEISEASAADINKEEKLWSSRLVLAIAEILDREQEEIARGLAELEDVENELFQSMHGDDIPDDDSPLAELTLLEKNMSAQDSRTERKRTKAWRTLFAECTIDNFELMLTTNVDGANIVLEKFEEKSDKLSLRLPSLQLPGLIGRNSNEGLETVSRYVGEHDSLLVQINTALKAFAETESISQAQLENSNFSELSNSWNKAIEQAFPKSQYGRVNAEIHILPGFPGTTLLNHTLLPQQQLKNGILVSVQ